MILEHTVTPTGKVPEWLPRVGINLLLDKSLQQLSWYGRDPFETYPDRKTGVRWVTLKSATGISFKISASQNFSFSAMPVNPDNLTRALYPFQLKPNNDINLNIDYAHSGVGCTAISVLDKYPVNPIEYMFHI